MRLISVVLVSGQQTLEEQTLEEQISAKQTSVAQPLANLL